MEYGLSFGLTRDPEGCVSAGLQYGAQATSDPPTLKSRYAIISPFVRRQIWGKWARSSRPSTDIRLQGIDKVRSVRIPEGSTKASWIFLGSNETRCVMSVFMRCLFPNPRAVGSASELW